MTVWHVASTLARQEKRVVTDLVDMGFQAVFPRYFRKVVVGVRSRRPTRSGSFRAAELVLTPAFPNYVIYSGSPWQRAREVDGVTAVIPLPGDRDRAAVLPGAVVARLMGPEGDGIIEDLNETIEALHKLLAGQKVRIISGLMHGTDGVVVSSTHARVRLLLTSATEAVVPTSIVRVLETV